jgi:hypothetical protein
MTFQEHVARRDNPHQVTKAQLGLNNIQNYPLANATEISAMARTDRYINASDTAAIQAALIVYMKEVGLMDSSNNLLIAPVDALGTVTFEIQLDHSLILRGNHSLAKTVDLMLSHPNLATPRIFDSQPINSTLWIANTAGISLTETTPYRLDVVYRNVSGGQISKAILYSANFNLVVTFLYDSARAYWYYDFKTFNDWTGIDPASITYVDLGSVTAQ